MTQTFQSSDVAARWDRAGRDTSFGKIIEAAERAERSQAPVENTADRYAALGNAKAGALLRLGAPLHPVLAKCLGTSRGRLGKRGLTIRDEHRVIGQNVVEELRVWAKFRKPETFF